MDRRNFMGFLPSIGAAPFIAKEIITDNDLVIVKKPELIKEPAKHNFQDLLRGKLQITVDGEVIGEGYMTQVDISTADYFSQEEFQTEAKRAMYGPRRIRVEGVMTSLVIS